MAKPPQPNRRRGTNRRLSVQPLEDRRLLAAAPLGATVFDTGEFLLGSVGVVPIFFESDGTVDPESQDWDSAEIDATLDKITEGVNWWSRMLDTLDTVHSLEFVVDDTFARDPVATPYEPIDRISNDFTLYAGGFLEDQGYGDAGSFENAVHRFNHDQRLRLGTDWAFSIFVVDASDGGDNEFAPGGSFSNAFAFPGGLFFVLPSVRPASTVAHEMGHIFWARDEYPGGGSWTDTRGYYNAQNLNAADNTTPGFEQQVSIMRANEGLRPAYAEEPWETPFSPASTLAMVGWRDSDGDGIFDVADVPLALDAVGHFDAASERYHFRGEASAVPLRNQNSWGPQSDITLNRVSRLEYSLDEGPWQTAATPDAQRFEFDLSVEIDEPFDTIRWRAVDDRIGVTSGIAEASRGDVAFSTDAVRGFAFLDLDGDGERDDVESLLPGAAVSIRREDGTSLPSGLADAATLGAGSVGGVVEGISIEADGVVAEKGVSVGPLSGSDGRLVFRSFDKQRLVETIAWSDRVKLVGRLEEPGGNVTVRFRALDRLGYGRVEAFDADGNLIARRASEGIGPGEAVEVTVSDPEGRIAAVRAFGHAGIGMAIESIEYGTPSEQTTDASGGWTFPHLPDGTYRVDVAPPWADQAFDESTFVIDVVDGHADPIRADAQAVLSPRYNELLPADVNADNRVTTLDALLVINDLSRNGARRLAFSERVGRAVDVNADGSVTSLDALLVINAIARGSQTGSAEGEGPDANSPSAGVFAVRGPASLPAASESAPISTADGVTSVDRVLADWPESVRIARFGNENSGHAGGDETGDDAMSARPNESSQIPADPDRAIDPLRSEIREPFLSSKL